MKQKIKFKLLFYPVLILTYPLGIILEVFWALDTIYDRLMYWYENWCKNKCRMTNRNICGTMRIYPDKSVEEGGEQ